MPTPIEPSVLKDQPLFSELTSSELENLGAFIFEKTYQQNSTLFVEGMSGEILYMIRRGKVEILKKMAGGQEKVLATLQPGEFLGEMSLIENQPRSATARVAQEAVLLVMTKKSFQGMLEKHPPMGVKILMAFLRTCNQRLRLANETLKQV
jgi:CRP-like cAMP-binding protein